MVSALDNAKPGAIAKHLLVALSVVQWHDLVVAAVDNQDWSSEGGDFFPWPHSLERFDELVAYGHSAHVVGPVGQPGGGLLLGEPLGDAGQIGDGCPEHQRPMAARAPADAGCHCPAEAQAQDRHAGVVDVGPRAQILQRR